MRTMSSEKTYSIRHHCRPSLPGVGGVIQHALVTAGPDILAEHREGAQRHATYLLRLAQVRAVVRFLQHAHCGLISEAGWGSWGWWGWTAGGGADCWEGLPGNQIAETTGRAVLPHKGAGRARVVAAAARAPAPATCRHWTLLRSPSPGMTAQPADSHPDPPMELSLESLFGPKH
jgi:hypothetical protein